MRRSFLRAALLTLWIATLGIGCGGRNVSVDGASDGGDIVTGDAPNGDAMEVIVGDSADTPTMCPPGRVSCGGACVDLTSDPSHCGGCGNACASGSSCMAATCVAACALPRMMCGTPAMCVDTSTDAANCGMCGRACGMNEMCSAGSCTIQCGAGRRPCSVGGVPTCVDVQTDPAHCGGCGMACGMGVPCTGGACGCNAPFQMCGTACVNPMTDTTNCGRCGNICAGGTVCRTGACMCPTGQALCGGRCIDVQGDAMNCGACGRICGRGMACSMGMCACAPGRMMCGMACVDIATDNSNCGACGNLCAGGTVCNMGVCGCPAGRTFCSGACVDLMTDRANCMMCGRACAMGQVCAAGACSTGVDVMLLVDVTGSNFAGVRDARATLPMRLVAPLLALTGVNVGVATTNEFPTGPYGAMGDRPFVGVLQPTGDMAMLNTAIMGIMNGSGGDQPDGMVEGFAPLVGLPLHPTSTAMTCTAGRVPGGCWRPGARRFIVLVTDDIFHNGPDPTPTGTGLYAPYMGITPAPAVWPDVLAGFRTTSTTLLFMNSNAMGAMSPGTPQYTRILADLGQPATDAFIASDAMRMGTAADAVVARIRALTGL